MSINLALLFTLFILVFGMVLLHAAGREKEPVFIAPAMMLIIVGITLVVIIAMGIK